MIYLNLDSNFKKVKKFNINDNGIQLSEDDINMEFRVDVFRSQPLFIFTDKLNNLHIFDKMEYFYENSSFTQKIDIVGFWEIILFGTSLWTRTLYQNLIQLPSASSLIINKKTQRFTITRYWDFNVQKNNQIKSIDDASIILNKKLENISMKLDKNKKYILGLSGGLDARITLAYIAKYIESDRIKLFTYANSINSLEYNLSKKICDKLNLKAPLFHKLTEKSYRDALEYLPIKSGGQISINHCHIIDFLKHYPVSEEVLISTYFSDAIYGWECNNRLSKSEKIYNPYIHKIDKCSFLDKEVKNQIKIDADNVTQGYNSESNISSLREYIYISERNQKFHNYLFSIQKDFSSSNFDFYNNFDLFKFSLSIPNEFKHHKKIEYYLLEKYFNEISHKKIGDISSNRFFRTNNSFSLSKLDFKFRNRVNALLRILTMGKLQVKNKFQTEELERTLYMFKKELDESFELLSNLNVLGKEHSFLKSIPLSSYGISDRYVIISIANLFK